MLQKLNVNLFLVDSATKKRHWTIKNLFLLTKVPQEENAKNTVF